MEYAGIAEYNQHGFQDSLKVLFANDTVKNCDTPAIDLMFVYGQGCQGRKIISQQIEGKDKDYYHIHNQQQKDVVNVH